MKLSDYVLEELAEMVVGDAKHFPRRTSYYITRFFESIDLPFKHDNSQTRRFWAKDRLIELNGGPARSPDLPSDDLCKVICRLFESDDFARANKGLELPVRGEVRRADVNLALESFNEVVKRHGIVAQLDKNGTAFLRNTGTGISTEGFSQKTQPLSPQEKEQREKLAKFLDRVSEDEFIEEVLVPLFQRLTFRRVSPTGHKDKSLEFGKDLWMKFQIPTGHWLYFCAQVKKDKIDSSNASGERNVASVLNQARMAFTHPIFDPEANCKVLLDHLFVISASEITKQAKEWLGQQLDDSQRRQIIFMDRGELLNHAARILIDLKVEEPVPEMKDRRFYHAADAMRDMYEMGDAPSCSTCGAIMVRNGSCYRCMSCGSTNECDMYEMGDAPSCSTCGAIMVRNGSCYRCMSCGSTNGCS